MLRVISYVSDLALVLIKLLRQQLFKWMFGRHEIVRAVRLVATQGENEVVTHSEESTANLITDFTL